MKASIARRLRRWAPRLTFLVTVVASLFTPIVFSADLPDARVDWRPEVSYVEPSPEYPYGIKSKLAIVNITIFSEHVLAAEYSVRSGLVSLDYYFESQASPEGIHMYTCVVANLNDEGSAIGYGCFTQYYAEDSSAKARSREFHEVWESLAAKRVGL